MSEYITITNITTAANPRTLSITGEFGTPQVTIFSGTSSNPIDQAEVIHNQKFLNEVISYVNLGYARVTDTNGVILSVDNLSEMQYAASTTVGGDNLDATYNIGPNATVTVDSYDVQWALTGAYSFVVDLALATGVADGFTVVNGTDQVSFLRSAANAIAVDIDVETFNLSSNNNLVLASSAFVNIDGDQIRIDGPGTGNATAIYLGTGINNPTINIGSASAQAIGVTSGSTIALNSVTSIALTSGSIILEDGNKAGSTYTSDLVLSDNTAEWDDFETNFGEVSVLNALNQAVSGTDPSEGGMKYERVDTGVWEVPQVGVEYYDGYFHGVRAYYKRFKATITVGGSPQILEAGTAAVGFKRPLQGFLIDSATGQVAGLPSYITGGLHSGVSITAGGDLVLWPGTSVDDIGDSYDLGVSYVKALP